MLREFVRARWSFAAPERHGGRRALRVFHKDAAGLHAANAPGGISEEDDVACEAFHGKIFADRADGDALGLYTLVAQPEGGTVGTVDEDFAVESLAVDIVLLGNTSWRIRRVQSGSVLVEDAQGAPPTVPFWRGEAPARTDELSQHVAALREEISSRIPHSSSGLNGHDAPEFVSTVHWLRTECGLDQAGAEQILEYVLAGRAVLGAVPTQTTVIAERFFDESGGMQLVIHAPFGARINNACGLALRKRFCRSFNFELQAAATDNGLNISLSEQHSFPLADVFHFLLPNSV